VNQVNQAVTYRNQTNNTFKDTFHSTLVDYLLFINFIIYYQSLLRNFTFVMLIVYQTVDAFLLNGFATFIPKMFETMFGLSKSTAGVVAGN
jgi:hypothetical protein